MRLRSIRVAAIHELPLQCVFLHQSYKAHLQTEMVEAPRHGDAGTRGDEEEGQGAGEKLLPSAPCSSASSQCPIPHVPMP